MFHDVVEVLVLCVRAGCGHELASHDCEIGYCEECMCTGFLTEDSFADAEDEVEELDFDDGA